MDRITLLKKMRNMLPSTNHDPEKVVYDQLLQASDDGSQSLNSDDEHHFVNRPANPKIQLFKRLMTITAKIFLVCFAAWGIIDIGRRTIDISIARPNETVSCSCGGTTVAEAISRGCKFTPLAIAWLPAHCLDMELAEEFDRAGPGGEWEYWADLNGTIPMTREEISILADTEGAVFYTTQEWHVMHCMYTWRKHYRSQFTGVTIEARSNGIEHIKHCEGIVRNRMPLLKIGTMAGIELNADLT